MFRLHIKKLEEMIKNYEGIELKNIDIAKEKALLEEMKAEIIELRESNNKANDQIAELTNKLAEQKINE
jgi:uncharacterized coiled-coil protein SlyX